CRHADDRRHFVRRRTSLTARRYARASRSHATSGDGRIAWIASISPLPLDHDDEFAERRALRQQPYGFGGLGEGEMAVDPGPDRSREAHGDEPVGTISEG